MASLSLQSFQLISCFIEESFTCGQLQASASLSTGSFTSSANPAGEGFLLHVKIDFNPRSRKFLQVSLGLSQSASTSIYFSRSIEKIIQLCQPLVSRLFFSSNK